MFRCQNEHCGALVPPRQPVNRIVTERRQQTYQKPIRKRKRGKIIRWDDVEGWEIVKEIQVCPKCFRKLTGREPRMVCEQKKPQTRKYQGFNTRPPRRKKWQNPRAKKAQGSGSHKKSSTGTPKGRPSSNSTRKSPVVQKVNPIKIIKE